MKPLREGAPDRAARDRAAWRVFEQVVEREPLEREALIAELCGGDPEVENAVRQLVAADARAGAFLERPAVAHRIVRVAGVGWGCSSVRKTPS